MEEIKKLFKNAGADKWTCSHKVQRYCDECERSRDTYFNPFPECTGIESCSKSYKDIIFNRNLNPEMQLEVLKALIRGRWIEFAQYMGELGKEKYYMGRIDLKKHYTGETFEETLAGIANQMWEELPESSKKKIKEILS